MYRSSKDDDLDTGEELPISAPTRTNKTSECYTSINTSAPLTQGLLPSLPSLRPPTFMLLPILHRSSN